MALFPVFALADRYITVNGKGCCFHQFKCSSPFLLCFPPQQTKKYALGYLRNKNYAKYNCKSYFHCHISMFQYHPKLICHQIKSGQRTVPCPTPAVSVIMYLQFLFIGVYFGYSMGIAPLLSYAYGNGKEKICKRLERYSYRFFVAAPPVMYALAFFSAPLAVSFFASPKTEVYFLALSGMRLYGIGYLFSERNIFTAIRLTAYGKGHLSSIITFLRSFALLLLFLFLLPIIWRMNGLWLAMPASEFLTLFVSLNINSSVNIRLRPGTRK